MKPKDSEEQLLEILLKALKNIEFEQPDLDANLLKMVKDECLSYSKSTISLANTIISSINEKFEGSTDFEVFIASCLINKVLNEKIKGKKILVKEYTNHFIKSKIQKYKAIMTEDLSDEELDMVKLTIIKNTSHRNFVKIPINTLCSMISMKIRSPISIQKVEEIINSHFSGKFEYTIGKKGRKCLILKDKFKLQREENNTSLVKDLEIKKQIVEEKHKDPANNIMELGFGNTILLLYRFPQKCRCSHVVLPVRAKVPFTKKNINIILYKEINSFYCAHCKILFCTYLDWDKCFKDQKVSIFPQYFDINDRCVSFSKNTYQINSKTADRGKTESFLHRAGYNVAQGGPSPQMRFTILKHFVDEMGMYKEVVSHLNHLITDRSIQVVDGVPGIEYYARAISCWKNDYEKITDYASKKYGIEVKSNIIVRRHK